ncbi:MAG TPA: OmpA family protein [Candidatus Eremiobacteraceae bacterium]|nr:OmpA family protein [Candidatus Eremiobacteraceae bacterium]
MTAIGGVSYVVSRAKKKADQIRQGAIANDAAQALKSIESTKDGNSGNPQVDGQAGENQSADAAMKKLVGDGADALMKKFMNVSSVEPAKLPEWKPAPADLVSSPSSKVPLKVSLSIVLTGTEVRGDYESILLVDSATDQQIHITGHQQFPNRQDMNTVMAQNGPNGFNASSLPAANEAVKINCSQIEFKADLENATSTPPYFCLQGREDKFPGTTSLGFSKKVFAELRAGKEVSFVAYENPMNAMFKSFKDLVSGSGDSADFLSRVLSAAPGTTPPPTPPIHIMLHRVGGDVAFPVIVNGQPSQLPALHITGTVSDGTNYGDAFILDDPDNPLFLASQTHINGTGQVTKIDWNSDKPTNPLEQQLQEEGRAKVYGIYFDFGSDKLRPESDSVLAEIAAVMKAHRDWKLRIEGHTDNIGGPESNQTLSSRRAEAVKKALAARSVSGDRLTGAGFGDTRPAARNDTLEGRALNRRVELVRE